MDGARDVFSEVRKGLDLSQNGLARELGVTQAAVSSWETGERRMTRRNLWALVGLSYAAGRPDLAYLITSRMEAR